MFAILYLSLASAGNRWRMDGIPLSEAYGQPILGHETPQLGEQRSPQLAVLGQVFNKWCCLPFVGMINTTNKYIKYQPMSI